MKKQLTAAILGCGSRGALFAECMLNSPEKFRITALCDPSAVQLEKMDRLYRLTAEKFLDEDSFFRERRADILFIASPDRVHVRQAIRAMRLGYHLLLEKPISDDRKELEELLAVKKETGAHVSVCHELRYAKGFEKCAQIIRSGRLGRLYAIDASERVRFFHWAQAYVRGIGAFLASGYSALFAKCSHDLDLIQAYAGGKCLSVSSVGDRAFFVPENAPVGATERCLDCPHKDTCTYSAKKIYIDGWHAAGEPDFVWPYNKVTQEVPLTEAALTQGLLSGPYGKCVFTASQDMVDHQFVQMTFENGIKASLKMVYAAAPTGGGRRIAFYFTEGEMILDEREDTIELLPFGGAREKISITALAENSRDGHGGGDALIVDELYEIIVLGKTARTSLEESIESHLMGIAAEESRESQGKLVYVH